MHIWRMDLQLRDLVLGYGDHVGKPELREWIAAESTLLKPEHILITSGAAAALFIVSTSLLKRQDRLLVAEPVVGRNIETPRAIGAEVEFLQLEFEKEFSIDVDLLRSRITSQTKIVSLTFPHNPTGSTISRKI